MRTKGKEILVCVLECSCPGGIERIELGNKRGEGENRGDAFPLFFFPMTRITPQKDEVPVIGHIMHVDLTNPVTPDARKTVQQC